MGLGRFIPKAVIRTASRAAAKTYLRLTPGMSLVDGVTFNSGRALSRHMTDWQNEPEFSAAYSDMWTNLERNGMGRRSQAEEKNYTYLCSPWKMHVACTLAFGCHKLGGDFVDIGTGLGAVTQCVENYIRNCKLEPRRNWLIDRWDARDVSHLQNAAEKARNLSPSVYVKNFAQAEAIFARYSNCVLIQGTIPDCLDRVTPDRIAFVYSDLNVAGPEIDAARLLWPKLQTGAVWMIDDYGGFPQTRKAYDAFAREVGCRVVSLAIGLGFIVKT